MSSKGIDRRLVYGRMFTCSFNLENEVYGQESRREKGKPNDQQLAHHDRALIELSDIDLGIASANVCMRAHKVCGVLACHACWRTYFVGGAGMQGLHRHGADHHSVQTTQLYSNERPGGQWPFSRFQVQRTYSNDRGFPRIDPSLQPIHATMSDINVNTIKFKDTISF